MRDNAAQQSLRILDKAICLKDNDDRMDQLMAEFSDGFATGWDTAVGECFRDALDIRYTNRIVAGQQTSAWTQGGTFSFSTGDTIYNTTDAYDQWDSALKSIDFAYQVLQGTPSRSRRESISFRRNASFTGSLKGERAGANVSRRKEVYAAIPEEWNDPKEISNVVLEATGSGLSVDLLEDLFNLGALQKNVEVADRFSGNVRLQLMVPNKDRSKLTASMRTSVTQDDFVRSLITGETIH